MASSKQAKLAPNVPSPRSPSGLRINCGSAWNLGAVFGDGSAFDPSEGTGSGRSSVGSPGLSEEEEEREDVRDGNFVAEEGVGKDIVAVRLLMESDASILSVARTEMIVVEVVEEEVVLVTFV